MADEIDLINELNQETKAVVSDAEKISTTTPGESPEAKETKEAPEPKNEDFEDRKPKLEIIEPEVIKDKGIYKKNARRWIRILNVIQKSSLTPVYWKNMLQPGDIEKLEAINLRKAKNPNLREEEVYADDDSLYHVMNRFKKLTAKLEELPFDEDEQDELVEPLAEVIEKYAYLKMTPEGALLMAVGLIMLPRLEPLFPKLFNKFK